MLEKQFYNNNFLRNFVVVVIALLASYFVTMAFSNSTYAQIEVDDGDVLTSDQENDEDDSNQAISVDFKFIAEPCDNLTKLVRRSLLVYDDQNNQIELTEEGIVFAETNIVQMLGAYMLDIGDEVVIDAELVEKYAMESLGLSESQVAAWSIYVPVVDYDLEHTQQPINLEQVVQDISDAMDIDEPDEPDEEDESVSAIWWVAGIASAVFVWYLLWRREEA